MTPSQRYQRTHTTKRNHKRTARSSLTGFEPYDSMLMIFLTTVQNWHKRDYHAKVCYTQTFTLGQVVFVDRPLSVAAPSKKAEKLAHFFYNKLMLRTLGPIHIVSVTPHTSNIHKNKIHNKVTIDWGTAEPYQFHENCTKQHQTIRDSPAMELQEAD